MVNTAKTPRKYLAAKVNAAKFMLFKLTLNQKTRNKSYAHFIFYSKFYRSRTVADTVNLQRQPVFGKYIF